MSLIEPGGIDCDIYPSVPNLKALYPYLTDCWRDIIIQRGVHELNSIAYPANSPRTARPDWRVDGIRPGSDLGLPGRHGLDPFQTGIAIANCLYGVRLRFSEDVDAGFARAVQAVVRDGLPASGLRRSGACVAGAAGRGEEAGFFLDNAVGHMHGASGLMPTEASTRLGESARKNKDQWIKSDP